MALSYIPCTTLFLLIVSFSIFAPRIVDARPPAIFIFGDSTADVGTNTYITNNRAKADFLHNGIDLIGTRPTGRFSNGLITVDFLSMLMGFERSPEQFLLLNCQKSSFQTSTFRGANFASGGAGLLNITALSLRIIPMSEQVSQFVTVRRQLAAKMGQSSTNYLLSRSVFIMSIGSNDILEYFDTNNTMPKEQFIAELMTAYETQIKVLYGLGARKFGFISVLPLGCCPAERIHNTTGGCLEAVNVFVRRFYRELDTILYKIRLEFPDFKFSHGDTYRMTMTLIRNPARFNMTNVDTACCGGGRLNAEDFCHGTSSLCADRNGYAFWDGSHPTEAGSRLAARALYNSELRYSTPIDFSQLAA